jgi:hypothetical protein
MMKQPAKRSVFLRRAHSMTKNIKSTKPYATLRTTLSLAKKIISGTHPPALPERNASMIMQPTKRNAPLKDAVSITKIIRMAKPHAMHPKPIFLTANPDNGNKHHAKRATENHALLTPAKPFVSPNARTNVPIQFYMPAMTTVCKIKHIASTDAKMTIA